MPLDLAWAEQKPLANAQVGDCLILGKALGLGLYRSAYVERKLLSHDQTLLHEDRAQGADSARLLACLDGVHAILPLDGRGFLGAIWSCCQQSGLRASLRLDHIPLLPSALALAESGVAAADWHWPENASHCWYAPKGQPLPRCWQGVLSAPEAGGGLLVSCTPDALTEVLSLFLQQDFNHAAVIGTLKPKSRHRQQIVLH